MMSVFIYEKDDDGIVTVTMDMTGPVNAVNAEYNVAMEETVSRLEVEDDLSGVIFASAKKVFFAGADLKELVLADSNDVEGLFAEGESFKSQLRRLEKLPVPVVAAINGAALGGGYELSLACNYRLAYNHKSVQIGLPECALGVYPAGGGVVRLTKLIGVESALDVNLKKFIAKVRKKTKKDFNLFPGASGARVLFGINDDDWLDAGLNTCILFAIVGVTILSWYPDWMHCKSLGIDKPLMGST